MLRQNLDKFLVLFNRLKKEVKESTQILDWLPNEKADLQSLCYELDSCYETLTRGRWTPKTGQCAKL
jgi:hypothetical protein